jgi:hypothetical protein
MTISTGAAMAFDVVYRSNNEFLPLLCNIWSVLEFVVIANCLRQGSPHDRVAVRQIPCDGREYFVLTAIRLPSTIEAEA